MKVGANYRRNHDTRTGRLPAIVLWTDRGLKTGKLDEFELTAKEARKIALALLQAADNSES